jgi:hypothetical protein
MFTHCKVCGKATYYTEKCEECRKLEPHVCICEKCREWRRRYQKDTITTDEVIEFHFALEALDTLDQILALLRNKKR